jgi:hypothetical protein
VAFRMPYLDLATLRFITSHFVRFPLPFRWLVPYNTAMDSQGTVLWRLVAV